MEPMAQPEAKQANPTDIPAPKCKLPAKKGQRLCGTQQEGNEMATTIP